MAHVPRNPFSWAGGVFNVGRFARMRSRTASIIELIIARERTAFTAVT